MKITTSAPGKLILLGEHSVCYGEPALATAINFRTTVEVKTENFCQITDQPVVSIDLINYKEYDIRISYYNDKFYDEEHVKGFNHEIQAATRAITYLLNKLKVNNNLGLKIQIQSDIPPGCGLGSSAAFSVGVSSALMQVSGNFQFTVFDLANELEAIFHENPSGIDVYVSFTGGLVEFQKSSHEKSRSSPDQSTGDSAANLIPGSRETLTSNNFSESSKNTSSTSTSSKNYTCKKYSATQIDIKNLDQINIEIVNTNITRSTKNIVNKVKKLHTENPVFIESCCSAITALVKQFSVALSSGNSNRSHLAKILEKNHHVLNAMGCSHNCIDKIFNLAKHKYQTILKITGAGGGGCVFSIENLNEDLVKELEADGFTGRWRVFWLNKILKNIGFEGGLFILMKQHKNKGATKMYALTYKRKTLCVVTLFVL